MKDLMCKKNGTFDISHLYSKKYNSNKGTLFNDTNSTYNNTNVRKSFKRSKRDENKRDKLTHEKRAYLNNNKLNST